LGILRLPNTDDRAMLDAIILGKIGDRRDRLIALKPRILRRYRRYYRCTRNLSRLRHSNLSNIQRADCEHCYDNGTAALADLKRIIKDVLPDRNNFYCPLCGLSKWDTFDHFVPKSLFPEFAVLPQNLVACCWKCNHLKGNQWERDKPPAILNAYHDPWPRKRFLVAFVDFDSHTGASVEFAVLNSLKSGRIARRRLTRHAERLKLLQRFGEAGAAAVEDYRISLAKHGQKSRTQRKRFLQQEAAGVEEKYGANHWRAVLLDALANCAPFLDSI
jgi:5-methylcytosine-specific restriction endonuclease McrA